jgi:DNA-binding transcriptional ArsR family regulator
MVSSFIFDTNVPNFIEELNKAFESRVRLGMMSLLVVQEELDFGSLKETLQLSDGNLASHMLALEKLGYVEVRKQFIGRKPNTQYAATDLGRRAFAEHLVGLEKLIKQMQS